MTPYQSDLNAHRDLWEKLQSLIVAPERVAWRDFCHLDGDNLNKGCAKYQQCPNHIKGHDKRCWDRPPQSIVPGSVPGYSTLKSERRSLPVLPDGDWKTLGSKTWCNHFSPLPKDKDNRSVVAFSYGVICEKCENRKNDVALAGLYRQCASPCPFSGCAVPQLAQAGDYDPDIGPPLGCPYNPRTGNSNNTGDYLPNAFARVQCFLSRADFLRYQTEVLGLHMGFFAFIETDEHAKENLYYLARHAYKSLNLTQMIYDPRTGWIPDHYEHEKSYVFQASRELAHPSELEDSLLDRIRGPLAQQPNAASNVVQNWRGHTTFDRDRHVLYVADGEMSAFCLRWVLEEARNLWGEDGVKDDNDQKVYLNELLDELRKGQVDNHEWYPRKAVSYEPHGWAVEDRLASLYLLGRSCNDLEDLTFEINSARRNSSGSTRIVDFMGFNSNVDGISLLESLGVVVRTVRSDEQVILATERFWRLIRYLQRYHDLDDPHMVPLISRLVDLATEARLSGRLPNVQVKGEDCGALLTWIVHAPALESSKAPMGRDGLPGHVMLRMSFKKDLDGQPQIETCARSWVAFPVFAYEPFQRRSRGAAESKQVGFFLGTVDDSDCCSEDGTLDISKLSEKLFALKQWMFLIGSVEASATYFEDIVSRSALSLGIQEERYSWLQAPKQSPTLKFFPHLTNEGSRAREVFFSGIDGLVDRGLTVLPVSLAISLLYETHEMHQLVHGGRAKDRFANAEECIRTIRQCAQRILTDISLLIARAKKANTEAFISLLELKIELRVNLYAPLLQRTSDLIEGLLEQSDEQLKRDRCQEIEISGGKKFSIKSLPQLELLRTRFRQSDLHDPQLEAKNESLLPFKAMYKHLLEDFCVKANVSNSEPFITPLTTPIRDARVPYVRRAGYVYHVPFNATSQIHDAERLVHELVNGSTAQDKLVAKGLTDIVDIWVAVKHTVDKKSSIVARPLLPNWHAGEQSAVIEQKVKLDPRFNRDGIYWIMVLTWLGHLEGGVRV